MSYIVGCGGFRAAAKTVSFPRGLSTEPDVGSDAGSVRTTAMREGDHYVLNGTKRFITNAPHAGLFTVMARTDLAQKGPRGVSAFVVEAGVPGLSIGKPEKKWDNKAHMSLA